MKTETAKLILKGLEKTGLSQTELSKKLGLTTCQFISNIIRGESLLPANRVKIVSDTLKIPKSRFIWAYSRDASKKYSENINHYKKVAGL